MNHGINPQLALLPINGFGDVKRQIVESLKAMIQAGQLAAGEKLPPTSELAAQWEVRTPTVQAALSALTKAGLLDRKQGSGTYVRAQHEALRRVGIFFDSPDTLCGSYTPLNQATYRELCVQLAAQGMEHSLWMDPRPRGPEQAAPWSKLLLAAERREFQLLITMGLNGEQFKWMPRLAVPIVHFNDHHELSPRVTTDMLALAMAGVEALAKQGCRRVALISGTHGQPYEYDDSGQTATTIRNSFHRFAEKFRNTATALGLECRPEWLQTAKRSFAPTDFEPFGDAAMTALWQPAERPDGVFIYTDFCAKGALQALLRLQVAVPTELKLALFRNGGGHSYYNPFPATYVENDPAIMANSLIRLAHDLLAGHAAEVEIAPWRLVAEEPLPFTNEPRVAPAVAARKKKVTTPAVAATPKPRRKMKIQACA